MNSCVCSSLNRTRDWNDVLARVFLTREIRVGIQTMAYSSSLFPTFRDEDVMGMPSLCVGEGVLQFLP